MYIKLFRGNNTIRESLSLYLQKGKIIFERCFLQNLRRNKWNQVRVRWVTSTDRISESGRLSAIFCSPDRTMESGWFGSNIKQEKNWFTAVNKNIDCRWKQKKYKNVKCSASGGFQYFTQSNDQCGLIIGQGLEQLHHLFIKDSSP